MVVHGIVPGAKMLINLILLPFITASIQYSSTGSLHELELVQAASEGHLDILKLYLFFAQPKPLESGKVIHLPCKGEGTKLYQTDVYRTWYDVAFAAAILNGQERCASILINTGFTTPQTLTSELFAHTCKSGLYHILQKLLEYDWDTDFLRDIFTTFCHENDLAVVKILLSTKSSIFDKPFLDNVITGAIGRGLNEIAELLLEHGGIPSTLYSNPSLTPSLLRMIIEKGFDVNSYESRTFHSFLSRNTLEHVKILIDAGFNPSDLNTSELSGAIFSGNLEILKYIFELGRLNDPFNQLFRLAYNGRSDEMKELTENRLISNSKLRLSLLISAASGNLEVFRFLAETAKILALKYPEGDIKISNLHIDVMRIAVEYDQIDIIMAAFQLGMCPASCKSKVLSIINGNDIYVTEFFDKGDLHSVFQAILAAVTLGKIDFCKLLLNKYLNNLELPRLEEIYRKAFRKGHAQITECIDGLRPLHPENVQEISAQVAIAAIQSIENVFKAVKNLNFMDYTDPLLVHDQHVESCMIMAKAIRSLQSIGYNSMADLVRRLQDGLTAIQALRELGLPPDLVEQKFFLVIGIIEEEIEEATALKLV